MDEKVQVTEGKMEMVVNKAERVMDEGKVAAGAAVKGSLETEFENERREEIIANGKTRMQRGEQEGFSVYIWDGGERNE